MPLLQKIILWPAFVGGAGPFFLAGGVLYLMPWPIVGLLEIFLPEAIAFNIAEVVAILIFAGTITFISYKILK